MSALNYAQIEIVFEECCNCGIVFGVPKNMQKRWLEKGDWFFCPLGHKQHYSKSEVQKLQERLDAEKQRHERTLSRLNDTERSLAAQKGVTTRLKRRAAAGVCPCCNRTFKQLAAHMKSQHPDFAEVTP